MFLAALALALPASSADAAADVTAPVIKTNAAAGFLIGGVLSDTVGIDDWDGYTFNIPMLVKWSVTDNSGQIYNFEIYSMAADSWPDVKYGQLLLGLHTSTPTPWAAQVTDGMEDYDGSMGSSGDTATGWKMVATDCSGNTSSVNVQSYEIEVLQENNQYMNRDAENSARLATPAAGPRPPAPARPGTRCAERRRRVPVSPSPAPTSATTMSAW